MRLAYVLLIALQSISAGPAYCADLIVLGTRLEGALNVDVGGVFYNVEFVDGSCVELFDGCDSAEDFTFNSMEDGAVAAQALLDEVFIDGPLGNFDSQTGLTRGCGNGATECQTWIPTALFDAGASWEGASAVNRGGLIFDVDEVIPIASSVGTSTSVIPNWQWARFTLAPPPVPSLRPAALWIALPMTLIACGLSLLRPETRGRSRMPRYEGWQRGLPDPGRRRYPG